MFPTFCQVSSQGEESLEDLHAPQNWTYPIASSALSSFHVHGRLPFKVAFPIGNVISFIVLSLPVSASARHPLFIQQLILCSCMSSQQRSSCSPFCHCLLLLELKNEMTHQKILAWISNLLVFRVLLVSWFWIQNIFKKSVANSSFHIWISSSLIQTRSIFGYSVHSHFTPNQLLHAAPHRDDSLWQHLTVTSSSCPCFALTIAVALSTVATRGCCVGQLTLFMLGCTCSTLIHLLLNNTIFMKD